MAPNATAVEVDEKVPNPPLVQLTSPWLSSLTSRIRSRPIPWEGYARADLVSQDELKMIRSIDTGNAASDSKDKVLDERGQEYATLYLRLLTKLSRTDTLQQVLVLVGDMLEGRDDRLQLFFEAANKLQSAEAADENKSSNDLAAWPWAPLVRLLSVADDFAQLKAAQVITLLLVAPRTSHSSTLTRNASQDVLGKLLSFLAALINTGTSGTSNSSSSNGNDGDGAPPPAGSGALQPTSSPDAYADGNGADIAIQLLEALLRTQQFRRFVWKDEMKRQGDTDSSSPGVVRGLVYILQNALVAPKGSGSGSGSGGGSSRNGEGENDSNEGEESNGNSGSSTPRRRATKPVTFQTQYQVIFCLWLLSFDTQIASQLNRKFSVIPLLVDLARSAVKEKVIRVSVATLRNLLENAKGSSENAVAMLGSKLLPLVENFKERKWSDDDIVEDLEYIHGELTEKLKGMSTLDEYLSELASGKLTWDNPAHELDDFWRANGQKMLDESQSRSAIPESEREGGEQRGDQDDDDDDEEEESKHKQPQTALTRLLSLLVSSKDDTTLAVAVHDVGKIITFTETGRKKINDYSKGKITVMGLMSHSDPEVKYRALATVGKLMSASWRQ